MERVKHDNFCRAVAEDNTALLLSAVGNFRKEALGRIRKGSDDSRALDQEMSARLLHLACKHDAVECARLLLEGGSGITAAPIDARDQLTRTPLHVAAETHSARCIELLLSKNAGTDLMVVDGRPLLSLEIALMSRRVQTNRSLDNPIEDLLSFLKQRDLNAVRLLAEKTRVAGELAYRYAMEGRVPALAMLLLVVEEKISQQEALSMGDASACDGNERSKALLCEIQLLNQFGSASWRDHNDRRTLPPLLRAAKVGDMNVIKMLLMGNADVNEADSEGNKAIHWSFSGASCTKEPRIVWLLLKNGTIVFQGNKLWITGVQNAAAKGNCKALQSLLLHAQGCIDIPTETKETPLFFAVNNGSVDCAKLLLCIGADTKARNLRKQRPTDVATSQDMRFILSSANVLPCDHSSPNRVMRKEIYKDLLGDEFDDLDKDYCDESYTGLKTSVSQRDFWSSNRSAQGSKSKSQYVPKQAQGSKFVPWAKASSSGASTTTAAKDPATLTQSTALVAPATSVVRTPTQAPVATAETAPPSAQPQVTPTAMVITSGDSGVYSEAASNLVSGNSLEQTIRQILDMGGGAWESDAVVRALCAAYNNPEKAIDYLYSGIPEKAEATPVARAPAAGQQTSQQAPSPAQPAIAPQVQPSAASAGPNANLQILFPQVTIHFCRIKLRTSIRPGYSLIKIVQLALLENQIKTTDFFVLLEGKVSDENIMANDIPNESNIYVCPRIRGGVNEIFTTTYESIDTVINDWGYEKMFIAVNIPMGLGNPHTACLLSPFSQYVIFHILLIVCREAHQRGDCYNGCFTLANFLMSENGHIKMSSSVVLKKYTPQGGEADYRQLYRILLTFVGAEHGKMPLYFNHLLEMLRHTNELYRRDSDFITVLINHPSLLTYVERDRLFCMIDKMIHKLPSDEKAKVVSMLDLIPGYSHWNSDFKTSAEVKEFYRVYSFRPSSYLTPGVGTSFHYCRNYLSHPADWVLMLIAEVAVSLLVDNLLAEVIKTLLSYKPPPNVDWDLIRVISNVRADTGTMFPESTSKSTTPWARGIRT